ncbi:SURF1 family protein [Xylanimonas oleitrophica]|uniref:SURF1-like protein n=1 Tax=Xylanimonas oleitrophica TaxID=2607479 RepID=A0A2W5X4R5_9MICO|nr:SURF1 family protein [Xylanimonas oleitrophica]
MLGALVVAVLAVALCVRLGIWQLDRAYERADLSEQHAAAEVGAQPVGLGTLVAPQSAMSGDVVGRSVWVSGTYEPEGQMLVEGRALDGRTGYLVLTPLRVDDDGTGGASWADLSGSPVLPVVRGWVPSASDAPGLAVPTGQVRITGWLQAGEATSGRPAPAPAPGGPPVTDAISTASLVNLWGGPIWDGYLVVTGSQPPQVAAADGGPAALPRPVVEGAGVNLQSLFYAVEWWVFGLFALALWVRLARDELAAARAGAEQPGGTAPRPRRGKDAGIAGLPG